MGQMYEGWVRSPKIARREYKGSAVYPESPLFRQREMSRSDSIHFQRIHVDGPTQAGRPAQLLYLRQPTLQKALQCGPRGGLDQEMRTEVVGPARDQGAGGTQHFDGRRVAQPAAGIHRVA